MIDLYVEDKWIRAALEDLAGGRLRGGALAFMDAVFDNEVSFLSAETGERFDKMLFREGVHRCWFDLKLARDLYRDWATRCDIPMHADVVRR